MALTFGLDISHYQSGALSLARARSEGCEFVFIKATEGGTYTDTAFAARLAESRAAGLLAAAYVYQRADSNAKAHVDRIAAVVPRDVPVIPDVEKSSGYIGLTRDIVDGLRAAGYTVPLLYLPRWYWQQIGSPSLAGLPPLWSSRYPDTNPGNLGDEYARVPASYWDGYGGLGVAVLQFTSSAVIAGQSPLDADAYRGTREQLAALLGYTHTAGPAATRTTFDEETEMLVPAGVNEHVVLPCAGRPLFWYLFAAFEHSVVVHQAAYVMPTVGSAPEYAPGGWDADWTFAPDRPGPLEIPRTRDGRQPVGVVLRYTADHPFTLYCG